jgi:extracellular elastinolytic metalloproteinase
LQPGQLPNPQFPKVDPVSALAALQEYLDKDPNIDIQAGNPKDWSTVLEKGSKYSVVENVPFSSNAHVDNEFVYFLEKEDLIPVVNVEALTDENWFNAQVSKDGKVIALNDWTSAATYHVYPSLGLSNDPGEGTPYLIQDPEDQVYSPRGWTSDLTTKGNNVISQQSRSTSLLYLFVLHKIRILILCSICKIDTSEVRAQSFSEGAPNPALGTIFDFPIDASNGNPRSTLDSAVTNAFYAANLMHDILSHYGFTPEAGNFQNDNFGRGGKGNDSVIVNVQDSSSLNNALFRTPPDGQSGIMTLFLFNGTGKLRDGSLDDSIVFHEYMHGFTLRTTGGMNNPNCMAKNESRGLNEGYASFFNALCLL